MGTILLRPGTAKSKLLATHDGGQAITGPAVTCYTWNTSTPHGTYVYKCVYDTTIVYSYNCVYESPLYIYMYIYIIYTLHMYME